MDGINWYTHRKDEVDIKKQRNAALRRNEVFCGSARNAGRDAQERKTSSTARGVVRRRAYRHATVMTDIIPIDVDLLFKRRSRYELRGMADDDDGAAHACRTRPARSTSLFVCDTTCLRMAPAHRDRQLAAGFGDMNSD